MWETMVKGIQMLAKGVLGISRVGGYRIKRAWWWNEELEKRVKEKQNAYTALIGSRLDIEKYVNFVKYKDAEKVAKKAVTISKNNAYERLYQKLDTK